MSPPVVSAAPASGGFPSRSTSVPVSAFVSCVSCEIANLRGLCRKVGEQFFRIWLAVLLLFSLVVYDGIGFKPVKADGHALHERKGMSLIPKQGHWPNRRGLRAIP